MVANDFVRVKSDYGSVPVVVVLSFVVRVFVIDSVVVALQWMVGTLVANQDPLWLFDL